MSEFTGNWFALLAFFGWPLLSTALYRALPPSRATIWTILGGYLILPSDVAIKFAMIPALDKNSIPNICACIGCLACSQTPRRVPQSKFIILVAVIFLLSPFVTSALNGDPVVLAGGKVLPGVGYYDAISTILYQTLFFLPFFLGWRYLRAPADAEEIFRALISAGLFYSIPMLLEVRISPQLSAWVYGAFPSSFITEARYGGFRPVVFLRNGLELSFFTMTTVVAALTIWRAKLVLKNISPQAAATYLALVVALSKSAGALIYTISGGFLICFAKPRTVARIATIVAAVALVYPLLRATDIFPTNTIVSAAGTINEERATSLKTRFDQENNLLARAAERPIFGWGRYGRSRVYAEDSNYDVSLTDGLWIITMGEFGVAGFVALFGLLALPVVRAARALRYSRSESEKTMLSCFALLVSMIIAEQIPNASISPWSWLLAGALLAKAEVVRSRVSLRRKVGPAIAQRLQHS